MATVVTQEPAWPYVGVVIGSAAVAAASAVSLVLIRVGGRGRRARAIRMVSLRRGGEVGATVAIIAALQTMGGLTPVTALFVALSFAIAEYVVSAGTSAPR